MNVLVTGATGCLGGGAARRLASAGHAVVGTGRAARAGELLARDGVRFERAELRDAAALAHLTAEAEVVVHCAARSAPWGRRADFEADNVGGTANVLAGCRAGGARRLVYVSTPSVYCDGRDRLGLREEASFASRPRSHYVRTKLAAERLVTAAGGAGLETIVVRPRAIFGPGDRVLLPRLVRALEEGRLPRIGSEDTLVDLTYVDNAVDALVLAVGADDDAVGRSFNVTNGEPVPLWPTIDALADLLELAHPTRRVGRGVAFAVAGLLELLHRALLRGREPRFTRASVELLAASTTFDISAARARLGYTPAVDTAEGLRRFARWWRSAS